jgi:hypothetical protein
VGPGAKAFSLCLGTGGQLAAAGCSGEGANRRAADLTAFCTIVLDWAGSVGGAACSQQGS